MYATADEWRKAAMQRPTVLAQCEIIARRKQANDFYATADKPLPTPDELTDQELYIQGKMDLQEYQTYLLFKHSKTGE